jgi:ribosomal protein L11 methyltransferase
MIPRDTILHVYEVQGEPCDTLPKAPSSFIGLWNEEEFSYLFFSRSEDDYVNTLIAAGILELRSLHTIAYSDWQTGIPAEGISLGGIFFVPTDYPAPPPEAVRLDPSVVFGDGTHPTTVSCLSLLADTVRNHPIRSLLDLGTGTGILALAASRLGVKRIVAVDKNRAAVCTALRNVEVNRFNASVEVMEGDARLFIDTPFDVVTANLPFMVLRDLIPLRYTPLHKFWIVSGINMDQGEVLKELFREQGFDVGEEHFDAPWVTFACSRREQKL